MPLRRIKRIAAAAAEATTTAAAATAVAPAVARVLQKRKHARRLQRRAWLSLRTLLHEWESW